jgi:predicted RND superfamily exporter protein
MTASSSSLIGAGGSYEPKSVISGNKKPASPLTGIIGTVVLAVMVLAVGGFFLYVGINNSMHPMPTIFAAVCLGAGGVLVGVAIHSVREHLKENEWKQSSHKDRA